MKNKLKYIWRILRGFLAVIFLYVLFLLDRMITFVLPIRKSSFNEFVLDYDKVGNLIGLLIIPIFFVSLIFTKWYFAFLIANSYFLIVYFVGRNGKSN